MAKLYKPLLFVLFITIALSPSFAQKSFPKQTTQRISSTDANSDKYVSNTILIKLKPGFKVNFNNSSIPFLNQYLQKDSIKILTAARIFAGETQPGLKGNFDRELYWIITYESKLSLDIVLQKANSLPFIDIAEACKKIESLYVPADPMADTIVIDSKNQWYLKKIKAYQAWDIEKGDSVNVVTGISDVGTEYRHPDLIYSVKVNQADNPNDTIDNDGDGYINNYYGWDFGSGANNGKGDNDPSPDGTSNAMQHGTKVAGYGFMTPDNNIGGAGVGYNCKFVPLKTSNTGGAIVAGYATVDYAALKRFKVLNISWGSSGTYSQIEQDVINNAAANDVLVVAAAGNVQVEVVYYPAGYDNVLAVAGTDVNDLLTTSRSAIVDICAPGYNVWTTFGINSYDYGGGSSYASPIVAGAAALVRSHFPTYTNLQAAEQLRVTADIIDTIAANKPYAQKMGKGRLNVLSALTNTNAISVRTSLKKIENSTNTTLKSNDTVTITCRFVNYLKPVNNVAIKLRCSSPYVKIIDSTFFITGLNTLDSIYNKNSPFRFIILQNTPNNTDLIFTLMYDNGNGYTDYENILVVGTNTTSYINLDTNQIKVSITDIGRIGYINANQTGGNGFFYKTKNTYPNTLIYNSGILATVSPQKVSNCIMNSGGTNFDNDFTSIRSSSYIKTPIADQYIYNIIRDTNSNKIGLEINQRAYSWKSTPRDKFVILEYKIKNISGQKLDSVNFTLFTDWDLPAVGTIDNNYYNKNRGIWDNTNKIGISYNTTATGLYGGTALLTNDKPIYYALDNAYAPTNMYDGFSDAEKFLVTSKGIGKTKSGLQSPTGNDISEVIGYTLFNINADETRTVAFAMLAGDDLFDIQASAATARSVFQQLKTSPTPIVSNTTICKDQSATINPSNVGNFIVLDKTPPGADTLYKGNSFVTGTISKDTTYYIAGTDSIFNSPIVSQTIKTSKPDGDFSIVVDNSIPGHYYFTNSDKGISSWLWNFGDGNTSNTQNTNHKYLTPGTYNVELIITNSLTCADTIVKQLVVSPVTTVNDQNIDNAISFYPNPANNQVHIKAAATVTVSITDLTGNIALNDRLITPDETLDVSSLATGVYLIKLQTDTLSKTEKLIVTH